MGKNTFLIRSALGWESMTVPVEIMSPIFVSRSITIRAPILSLERIAQLSQMALMVLIICLRSYSLVLILVPKTERLEMEVRPTCSSTLRSSGWNSTSSTRAP